MIPTVMDLPAGEELDRRWGHALIQVGWLDLPADVEPDPNSLRSTLEDVVFPAWAQLMCQNKPDPAWVLRTLRTLFGIRGMLFLYGAMMDPDDRDAVEEMLFRAFETAALWVLEQHQAALPTSCSCGPGKSCEHCYAA